MASPFYDDVRRHPESDDDILGCGFLALNDLFEGEFPPLGKEFCFLAALAGSAPTFEALRPLPRRRSGGRALIALAMRR
jgi:hypothetical protein